MNKKMIEFKLFANAFNIDLSLNDFTSRLLLQKKLYLMQVLGIDLGFRYGWYLRGPYCPALTKMAYELKEKNNDMDSCFQLNDRAQALVKRALDSYEELIGCKNKRIDMEEETNSAELFASLHYIKNFENISSREEAIKILNQRKTWYSEKEIAMAWNKLEEIHEKVHGM